MSDLQNIDPLVARVAEARAADSRRPLNKKVLGELRFTQNGDRCYYYSPKKALATAYFAYVDILHTGVDDLLLEAQLGCDWRTLSSATWEFEVMINGQIVYMYDGYDSASDQVEMSNHKYDFIVPAASSFQFKVKSNNAGYLPQFNVKMLGKVI